MERLLRIASPLGLYADEYDVETGRHLGNMPQAVRATGPPTIERVR
jgi:GH15 family glucan-1,4-alpha-glucosidase